MKRLIFVYLYRFRGEPVYVGQSCNPKRRHRQHLDPNGHCTPFEISLQKNESGFTQEIVDQCEDVPCGKKINSLENSSMDKFGTYQPATGRGFNFGRAEKFGNHTKNTFVALQSAAKAGQRKHDSDPQQKAARLLGLEKARARPGWKTNKAIQLSITMKELHKNPIFRAASIARLKKANSRPEVKAKKRKANLRRALKNHRTRGRYNRGLCSFHQKYETCGRKHAKGFVRCKHHMKLDAKRRTRYMARKIAGLI